MITPPVSLRDAGGVHHLIAGCPKVTGPATPAVTPPKGARQCCTWCLLHAGSTLPAIQTIPVGAAA